MYLKKLVLRGFKSFAERTEIEFAQGMTAIVGPNGSGKSNIVDAFKWVFGSHRPSELRSSELTDVVHKGEGKYRVNFAEVTVIFQTQESEKELLFSGEGEAGKNGEKVMDESEETLRGTEALLKQEAPSDPSLPSTDMSPVWTNEVSLTRRIYKDGSSEYFLNGQACSYRTLRDFVAKHCSIFSNTVLFEQGRIDALITASPAERLKFFESLAGISYYKVKKAETLSRLERVQVELDKLESVLRQLKREHRRLEGNAERARQFHTFHEEWKNLKRRLYQYEASQLREKVEGLGKDVQKSADRLQEKKLGLQALLRSLEEKRGEWVSLEEKNRSLQKQLEEISREESQKRETLSQMEQKATEEQAAVHFYELKRQDLQRELENMKGQRTELERTLKEMVQTITRQEEELTAVREKESALLKERQDSNQEKEEMKKRLFELQFKMAEHRNEKQDKEREIMECDQKIQSKTLRLTALEKEKVEQEAALHCLEGEGQEKKEKHGQLKSQLKALEEQWAWAEEEVRNRGQKKESCRKELADLRIKMGILEKMGPFMEMSEIEKRLSGLSHRLSNGPHPDVSEGDVWGWASELVDLSETPLSALAATLLKDKGHWLVVRGYDSVSKVIQLLGDKIRTLKLVVMEEVQHHVSSLPEEQRQGLWTQAEALGISVKEGCPRDLLLALLGNWALMSGEFGPGMDLTRSPARVSTQGFSFLYPGILNYHLLPSTGDPNPFLQAREYGLLQEKYTSLVKMLEELEACDEVQGKEKEMLEQMLQGLRLQIYEVDIQIVQTEKEKEVGMHKYKMVQEEEQLGREEKMRLDEHRKLLCGDAQRHQCLVEELEEIQKKENGAFQELLKRCNEVQTLCDEVQSLRKEREADRVRMEERRQTSQGEVEKLQRYSREKESQEEQVESRFCEAREYVHRTAQEGERLRQELGLLAQKREGSRQAYEEAEREGMEKRNGLYRVEKEKDQLQKEVETENEVYQQQLRQMDQRRLELQMLVQSAELELKEAFLSDEPSSAPTDSSAGDREGVKLEGEDALEGMESAEPESASKIETEEEFQNLKEQARRLQDQIQTLGQVDDSSLQEADQVKDRVTYLNKEYQELKTARDTLVEMVKEFDEEANRIFDTTLQKINDLFHGYMRKIFSGGKGLLQCQDVEGMKVIDFTVQIPGKSVTTIDLLSGGEKALVTFALLMSFFTLRPSAFYVLDEADGALDDSNVEKVIGLLKEIAQTSQVIFITHNKKTVAFSEQVLGISMGQDGVSRKVSIRLDGRARIPAPPPVPALAAV